MSIAFGVGKGVAGAGGQKSQERREIRPHIRAAVQKRKESVINSSEKEVNSDVER